MNPYLGCPLHRFMITNQSIVHFHGFYWGLVDAGISISVNKAAQSYSNRYGFLDTDTDSLIQGYFRLNQILIKSKRHGGGQPYKAHVSHDDCDFKS
jgi:hypothetical protein